MDVDGVERVLDNLVAKQSMKLETAGPTKNWPLN